MEPEPEPEYRPSMGSRLKAVVGSIHHLLNGWVRRVISTGTEDTQAQIYLYGSCALLGDMQVHTMYISWIDLRF